MTKRICLLIVCLLAACSFAAQHIDSFDAHVASIKVLEDKQVQAELGITAAQRAQMDTYADQFNLQEKNYLAQLKAQGKPEPSSPDDRMIAMVTTLKQKVLTVLTAAQLRRLREISLQAFGLNGLLDETIAAKVGLSKDQVLKMRKIYEDGSAKASDMMSKAMQPVDAKYKNAAPKTAADKEKTKNAYLSDSNAAFNKVMPDVQKVRDQTEKQMLAVITPKQKATYLALQGKRFVKKG